MIQYTIIETQKTQSKVKRSQFISYIRKNDSIPEFKSWLSQVKKNHYDGSHVCWAYRIYQNSSINKHCSDAGEPLGTAGKPILNILEKKNLIQIGIIIVRYFGGIKLGRKGLISTYSDCAISVIIKSKIISWNQTYFFRLESPMRYVRTLTKIMQKMNGKILKDESSINLLWTIQINTSLANKMINIIRSSTMGEATLERIQNIN